MMARLMALAVVSLALLAIVNADAKFNQTVMLASRRTSAAGAPRHQQFSAMELSDPVVKTNGSSVGIASTFSPPRLAKSDTSATRQASSATPTHREALVLRRMIA